LVEQLGRARWCRDVLPIADAARMTAEARIVAGDNLVAYDLIADAHQALAAILPALGMVLTDDPEAMERLRMLHTLKPLHGSEPVIDGGRQAGDVVTNQETGCTDAVGKDRHRNAGCKGACPRAKAGKRAGGRTC